MSEEFLRVLFLIFWIMTGVGYFGAMILIRNGERKKREKKQAH